MFGEEDAAKERAGIVDAEDVRRVLSDLLHGHLLRRTGALNIFNFENGGTDVGIATAEQRARSAASMEECARPDLLPQCLQDAVFVAAAVGDGEGFARFAEVDGAAV